jgi:hypothetical protein
VGAGRGGARHGCVPPIMMIPGTLRASPLRFAPMSGARVELQGAGAAGAHRRVQSIDGRADGGAACRGGILRRKYQS